ncbi:MAG: VWA domain-containing protein [Propionibacterium sp.]|nr:VWA domain-containing protein [Propionibacterium sp.]
MRRLRALLVALFAAVVLVPLVSAPQAAADEVGDSPLERFGACVRGGGQGSVLMLFDRSTSVRETDPSNARVTAAKYLVNQLAASMDALPEANTDVAIAGFDHVYERSLDWTPLTGSNVGTITADLDAYADRSDGQETDYWNAVDGARQELAGRVSTGEGQDCALMIWFSDGEYVVTRRINDQRIEDWGGLKPYAPDNQMRTPEEAAAARDAGAQDLCRPGGSADQLRSMDIVTLGIGLAVDLDPATFDLMRGFATGEGCGDITEPPPGEFHMATDVDELLLAFDQVLHEGGDVEETAVCVDTECAEGTRTFVLDGSIGKVQGLAQAPVEGTRILVRTRDGEIAELTRDGTSATLPGAELEWQWLSERTLSIELTRDGQSEEWVGPWGLVFVAPSATADPAQSTLRLYGDIAPTWVNRDVTLRSGAGPAELQLGLVDGEGNAIDPATLSEQTFLSVALLGPGDPQPLATDLVRDDMTAPLPITLADLAPGPRQLWVSLDITTSSWGTGADAVEGTQLEPIRMTFPLTVLPPEEFPTIASRVSFGETESADPVTVTVPLEGDGCVWLGGETRFTGYPQGLDAATLTSPATDEANCSTTGLELTLSPGDVGNGALVGETEVWLTSPSAAEPIAVSLDFDLQMRRPASQPVLWGTLIGITLLGIAIPVGILYLTKYLTAKIPGTAVLAGRVTGPVDDTRAFTDGGINIDVAQMQMAHLTGNRRRVDVAGTTLQAKMGLALTEPGYVVVEQPGRAVGGRTAMTSKGDLAKLPLAVQGNWTVALDPNAPHTGNVVVTVYTGPGAPGLDELLDDVRANIRDAVAGLREGLPPDAQPPRHDPWGGGPAGPPGPAARDPWANPPQAPPSNPWSNPPPAPPPNPSQGPARGGAGW